MKTFKIYPAILFIFILMNGCSENIVNPSVDDTLRTQLIGKWEDKNYEILSFNSDGTFIDTSFAIFSDNPNKYVPHFIAEGKYRIENEIVFFEDVRLVYAKAATDSFVLGFSATINPRKVTSINDELTLQYINILTPKKTFSPEINGEWEANIWMAVYDKNVLPNFKGALKNIIIIFSKIL